MTYKSIRQFGTPPALSLVAAALALMVSACAIDTGPDYGGSCLPDVLVKWQIQDTAGSPVTCDQAGAASVVALVDGSSWSVPCPPGRASGEIDVPLESNGMYNIAVDLYDQNNHALVPEQTLSPPLNVTNCGPNETMPAILVFTPSSSTSTQ
jgi:hypothetical protein